MKAKDLRERTTEDLAELEKSIAAERFQSKFKNFTNRLDDTSLIRKAKRDLARVKLILGERARGAAAATPATTATPAVKASASSASPASSEASETAAPKRAAKKSKAEPAAEPSEPVAAAKKAPKKAKSKSTEQGESK